MPNKIFYYVVWLIHLAFSFTFLQPVNQFGFVPVQPHPKSDPHHHLGHHGNWVLSTEDRRLKTDWAGV